MKRPAKPWRDPTPSITQLVTDLEAALDEIRTIWEEIPDDIPDDIDLRMAVAFLRMRRDMWREIAKHHGADIAELQRIQGSDA